ncbi:MAG: hypothetical protein J6I73_08520 [Treponema sp.]|nr:hypothetical protein [Treponema sp.]
MLFEQINPPDEVNSALNYSYAIIRSYIIRALLSTGFHCAFTITMILTASILPMI